MSINSEMTALADAIRTKSGSSGKLTIAKMTAAVNGIIINTGSDIDFTGVNVTPDKMLSGTVAINANGQKITGNIDTVTPTLTDNVVTVPQGYISSKQTLTVPEAGELSVSGNKVTVPVGYIKTERNAEIPIVSATLSGNKVTIPAGYNAGQTLTVAEAAAPTISGNVVTVNKGYHAEQKKVTVGTAKAAAIITPGTSDQSIAAGTYLSGKQTIKGDANLLPENIKKDVEIFGVVGTHDGESGGYTKADVIKNVLIFG